MRKHFAISETHSRRLFSAISSALTIKRSQRRKTCAITISSLADVTVHIPHWLPEKELHAFLSKHESWIAKHVNSLQALKKQNQRQYINNETFLYLGEPLQLRLLAHDYRTARIHIDDDRLLLHCPESWQHNTQKKEKAVSKWFRTRANDILCDRLLFWEKRMSLTARSHIIRSLKSRWGSCSSSGRITLNWRLIKAPLSVIDYVVIHELSHLVHMNHSPSFWTFVKTYCPRYNTEKAWLKTHGVLIQNEG